MKHRITLLSTLFLFISAFSQQTPKSGHTISQFGKIYEVSNPDFKTDTKQKFKAVFDIGRSFGDSTKINALFNSAAGYLNIHTNAGISLENLKVALVIHGGAANDILTDTQYKTKYGIDNPNTLLIKELRNKGVQIILCGQTAAYRNITKQDVLPEIQFSLSAMTALVQLQNEDYRLINF